MSLEKLSTRLEELLPLLMHFYRKDSHEEGPSDRLHTREFKKIVEQLTQGSDFGSSQLYPYLLYYFSLRYQEGLSLIGELPFEPTRVLDLFAKTGPFTLAALEHGAREVIMLDTEEKNLEIGAQIVGRRGYPVQKRIANPIIHLPLQGEFDLIICAYPPVLLKDDFILRMIHKLTPRGVLLLVDSSLPKVNQLFLERRDRLVKAGYPVQAPCIWQGECPALKSHAPCYAQRELIKTRLMKDLQRAASINLSSLKMSYLMVKKKGAEWPETPLSYRVISPPIDTLQGKRFFLCGTDGKKTIGSTLTEFPKKSRAFKYLKRGELIAIEDALVNINAIEIVENSIIKVIAPLGKPVFNLHNEPDNFLSESL